MRTPSASFSPGGCAQAGVSSITAVQPLHVAAWIKLQTQTLSAPTVKQHLAAIRHLFDWLVTGQVVPYNPAASVRGPSHTTRKGKTSVLMRQKRGSCSIASMSAHPLALAGCGNTGRLY
jgi:hypothetical protein